MAITFWKLCVSSGSSGRQTPASRAGSPERSRSRSPCSQPSPLRSEQATSEIDPEVVRDALRDFLQELRDTQRERVSKGISLGHGHVFHFASEKENSQSHHGTVVFGKLKGVPGLDTLPVLLSCRSIWWIGSCMRYGHRSRCLHKVTFCIRSSVQQCSEPPLYYKGYKVRIIQHCALGKQKKCSKIELVVINVTPNFCSLRPNSCSPSLFPKPFISLLFFLPPPPHSQYFILRQKCHLPSFLVPPKK